MASPLPTTPTGSAERKSKKRKRNAFELPELAFRINNKRRNKLPEELQNFEEVNQNDQSVSLQVNDDDNDPMIATEKLSENDAQMVFQLENAPEKSQEEAPEGGMATEMTDKDQTEKTIRRKAERPEKHRQVKVAKSEPENKVVEPIREQPEVEPEVEFVVEPEVQPEAQPAEPSKEPSEEQSDEQLVDSVEEQAEKLPEETSNNEVVEKAVEEALVDENEALVSDNTAEVQISTKRTLEDHEEGDGENSTGVTTPAPVPLNDVPSPTGSNSSADHHRKHRKSSKRIKGTHPSPLYVKCCQQCSILHTNEESYKNHMKMHENEEEVPTLNTSKPSITTVIPADKAGETNMKVVSDESVEAFTKKSQTGKFVLNV